MKTGRKLVLVGMIGLLAGASGVEAIHAQQVKKAPAYVVAEIEVLDRAPLKEYGEKAPATLAPFDSHYLVRGGKTQSLEGDAPKGIVIIAFSSAEKAREWYESPAYSAIRPLRQNATKSRIYIVEGVTD